MPLLPSLPIFHSSSSSKFPNFSFVTRSSTGPSLWSTPPSTCQPAGSPGSFQPLQARALCASRSARQPPAEPPCSAPKLAAAARESASTAAQSSVVLMDRSSNGLSPSCEFQSLQELGRRALEARERHVADVAEVLAPLRARVEGAGGQIPIERKEARGLLLLGGRARCGTDRVADGRLGRGVEVGVPLASPPRRFRFQLHEYPDHYRPFSLLRRVG